MSRKPIISKQIAGQTATQLDIRIINMPLYPATDAVTNVFYGYYKANDLRIEDASAEGNYVLGDIVSADSKTALLTALTNLVGTVTKADLKFYQLDDNKYTVRYIKDGHPDTVSLEGSFFTSSENNTVKTNVFSLLSEITGGSGYRKSITVNSTSSQTEYPVYVNVHSTAGTDTNSDIYLNGKVRSDWGDIRILSGDTSVPFGIVKKEATVITIAFSATLISGDNTFFLYYNRPSTLGVTKFGVTTDQHYDSAETYVGRNYALERLDNFVTEMASYVPDAILEGGDKIGSVTTDSTARLDIMNQVTAKHNAAAAAVGCPNYLWGWGNHDFENGVTLSDVVANYSSLPGLVSGTLYGTWEDDNYRYISLDAQYNVSTGAHLTSNQGYGYINADQLTWLTDTLAAATKPCIIFCHQLLCEEDTAKIFLTKRTYHVDNRTDVRAALENSGKVLFVLHGHTHITAHQIINGIPYLNLCDLNEPPSAIYSWNTPTPETITFNGMWGKIEVDRDTKIIRFMQEVQSGATVQTVYDFRIPYKTIFDTEYGDNPEKVFGFTGSYPYNKSNVITDATDLYVSTTNLITKPASIFDNDARLSGRTIKIYGLTDNGITSLGFGGFSAQGRIRFSMQAAALSNKYIMTMHSNGGSTTNEFGFDSSGNIYAYNGATKTTLQAYSINTWYEFDVRINISTQKINIYIDGVLLANNFSFKTSGGFSIDGLKLFTDTGNMFFDSLRFEKYISAEPAITSVGGEETL